MLDIITEGISTREVFGTINYKNQAEDKIIHSIFPHLVESLTEWIMEKKSLPKNLAKQKAKSILKWEGNVNTTVHQMMFMGTANRPDMIIEVDGLRIAIEFKKGDRGSDLRAGFGQSLIYSTTFDFVLYMFIDTSADSRIANARTGIIEDKFIQDLWNNFNIKFIAV